MRILVNGLEELQATLDAMPRELDRALVNTLNKGATFGRRLIVVPAAQATGLSRKTLNGQIPLQKAKTKNLEARIKPKSSGIPVPEYRWRHVATGRHPTRHRIMVGWPGGEKVAAGFVNPFGAYKAPITTRLYAYKGDKSMYVALAPSAAALRKVIYQGAEERQTSEFMATEMQAQLARIVAGRPASD
jgi:hypothetical protein